MKRWTTAVAALGFAASGCAPMPAPQEAGANQVAGAPRMVMDPWRRDECAAIYRQIIEQQRIAAYSGIMSTFVVEAPVRLNAAIVINSLENRAALEGCPLTWG